MYADIHTNGIPKHAQTMQHGTDAALRVKFFSAPKYLPERSREEERDVYDPEIQLEMVEIKIPGGDTIVREATPTDKRRFNVQYRGYKSGQDVEAGTDAKELGLTEGQLRRLEGVNIYSIEQLAACSDMTIQQMGTGGHELRRRAQSYLAAKPIGSEELDSMKKENAELRSLVEKMSKTLEDLVKGGKK